MRRHRGPDVEFRIGSVDDYYLEGVLTGHHSRLEANGGNVQGLVMRMTDREM